MRGTATPARCVNSIPTVIKSHYLCGWVSYNAKKAGDNNPSEALDNKGATCSCIKGMQCLAKVWVEVASCNAKATMVSNKDRLYIALYPSGVTNNDERR